MLARFDLGALVAAAAGIYGNPQLPQCRVDALANQLAQAGRGGTVMSGDNSATCPP